MTLARAAVVYKLTQRVINGVAKANKDSAEVLKEHFRKSGKTTYAGIGYSSSTTNRLDSRLAREHLGADATAKCTVPSRRESLSLPADAEPIVPAELAA